MIRLQFRTVLVIDKNSLQCLLISVGMHVLAITAIPAYENTGTAGSGRNAALKAELALPYQKVTSAQSSTARQHSKPSVDEQIARPADLSTPEKPPFERANEEGPTPLIGLPVPATPPYYESMELSEKPEVVEDIPPTLNQSLQTQESGYAIMKLRINEQGGVDEAVIEASDLGDTALQQLREAFQGVKFKPGKIGQTQVKTEMRIQISVEATPKAQSRP